MLGLTETGYVDRSDIRRSCVSKLTAQPLEHLCKLVPWHGQLDFGTGLKSDCLDDHTPNCCAEMEAEVERCKLRVPERMVAIRLASAFAVLAVPEGHLAVADAVGYRLNHMLLAYTRDERIRPGMLGMKRQRTGRPVEASALREGLQARRIATKGCV